MHSSIRFCLFFLFFFVSLTASFHLLCSQSVCTVASIHYSCNNQACAYSSYTKHKSIALTRTVKAICSFKEEKSLAYQLYANTSKRETLGVTKQCGLALSKTQKNLGSGVEKAQFHLANVK